MTATCSTCGGSGKSDLEACPECHGRGTQASTHKVTVKVPAGIADGQRIRVAGHGAAGTSGRRGDLLVTAKILPHKNFERKGDDLYTNVQVYFTTAAIGGKVDIPTLKGSVKMTIPPGTQSDQKFRLRGEGMPRLRDGGRGDLYAVAKVTVPKQITPRQRELLAQLAEMRTE